MEKIALRQQRTRYQAWLEQMDTRGCLGAETAFTVEELHSCDDLVREQHLHSHFLSLMYIGPRARLELRDWKHPQLNLDILQYTLLYNETCVVYLAGLLYFDLEEYKCKLDLSVSSSYFPLKSSFPSCRC